MEEGTPQNIRIGKKIVSIFLFLISGFMSLFIVYSFFPTVLSFDCFFGGECGGLPDVVHVDVNGVLIGIVFFVGAVLLQAKAILERKQYTILFNALAILLCFISILFFTGFAKILGIDF